MKSELEIQRLPLSQNEGLKFLLISIGLFLALATATCLISDYIHKDDPHITQYEILHVK